MYITARGKKQDKFLGWLVC